MKDIDGNPRAYPQHGDPYEEIYKSSAWYGLVPAQNTKYLNMSDNASNDDVMGPRVVFRRLIDSVAKFHRELATVGYYPETYAHYGADDSPDRHSWRDMIWQGDSSSLESSGSTVKDDENGSYNGWFRRGLPAVVEGPLRFAMTQESSGSGGDGTVPTDSGLAPAKPASRPVFARAARASGSTTPTKATTIRTATTTSVPNGPRSMALSKLPRTLTGQEVRDAPAPDFHCSRHGCLGQYH